MTTCPLGCSMCGPVPGRPPINGRSPFGRCNGTPGSPFRLVTPWWETTATHSLFRCSCPVPPGATERDMLVPSCAGYHRWRSTPPSQRPSLSQLSRKNKKHIARYA